MNAVETVKHIRVGVARSSRTIGTHYNKPGNPGRVLCGAPMTASDLTDKDAKGATFAELRPFNVCPECFEILNG